MLPVLNMKEDPIKAKVFDEAHNGVARWGPNHPGAQELAKDYTNSKKEIYVMHLCLFSSYIVSGHHVLGVFSVISVAMLSTVSLVYLASLFQWSNAYRVLIAIGKKSVNLWWSVGGQS